MPVYAKEEKYGSGEREGGERVLFACGEKCHVCAFDPNERRARVCDLANGARV